MSHVVHLFLSKNNGYQGENSITREGMLHFSKANWERLVVLQLSQSDLIQAITILETWDARISQRHPSIASTCDG
jgi:hypothetical protein